MIHSIKRDHEMSNKAQLEAKCSYRRAAIYIYRRAAIYIFFATALTIYIYIYINLSSEHK